jgi:hypothetical protein
MCYKLPHPSNKAIPILGLILDLFFPGIGMIFVGLTDDSHTNSGNSIFKIRICDLGCDMDHNRSDFVDN